MTERNAPYGPWTMGQTPGMGAEAEREMLGSLVALLGSVSNQGSLTMVAHASDLIVSASSTPDGNVHVAPGQCFVAGTQGATQGLYHGSNDSSGKTLSIAAADASFPRNDLVVGTMVDPDYLGGTPTNSNHFLLQVIQGTPAASPVDPATPPSSIVLARVSVPAVASGPTNVQSSWITDVRPGQGFGVYTPVWTTFDTGHGNSAPSLGDGQMTGWYQLKGKMLDVVIQLICGSTTNGGSGGYRFSLPASKTGAGFYQFGLGRLFSSPVGETFLGEAVLAPGDTSFYIDLPPDSTTSIMRYFSQANATASGRSPDVGGTSYPFEAGSAMYIQARVQVA